MTFSSVRAVAGPFWKSIPAFSPKYQISACCSDLGQLVIGKIVRGDFCALSGITKMFRRKKTIHPWKEVNSFICLDARISTTG